MGGKQGHPQVPREFLVLLEADILEKLLQTGATGLGGSEGEWVERVTHCRSKHVFVQGI